MKQPRKASPISVGHSVPTVRLALFSGRLTLCPLPCWHSVVGLDCTHTAPLGREPSTHPVARDLESSMWPHWKHVCTLSPKQGFPCPCDKGPLKAARVTATLWPSDGVEESWHPPVEERVAPLQEKSKLTADYFPTVRPTSVFATLCSTVQLYRREL